mgnify:CR=1 FL=1
MKLGSSKNFYTRNDSAFRFPAALRNTLSRIQAGIINNSECIANSSTRLRDLIRGGAQQRTPIPTLTKLSPTLLTACSSEQALSLGKYLLITGLGLGALVGTTYLGLEALTRLSERSKTDDQNKS